MITRSVLFGLKCTRKRLAAGLHPDPLGKLKRSLRPPSRIRGLGPPGRKGKEGNGKGGNGKGGNVPPKLPMPPLFQYSGTGAATQTTL